MSITFDVQHSDVLHDFTDGVPVTALDAQASVLMHGHYALDYIVDAEGIWLANFAAKAAVHFASQEAVQHTLKHIHTLYTASLPHDINDKVIAVDTAADFAADVLDSITLHRAERATLIPLGL